MSDEREEGANTLAPEHVLAVREGHGANCSSIGSVIDTLFASAVIGGAVFAAVLAAMKKEPIAVVSPRAADQTVPVEADANNREDST